MVQLGILTASYQLGFNVIGYHGDRTSLSWDIFELTY